MSNAFSNAFSIELLSPLRHRAYRHLFSAQVLALLGTGLTSVALALLAWEIAGEDAGAVLGIALALKMIAYVVIAPLVGGWLEQFPRKALLVTLDLLRAALVMTLPFITEVWQIYVVIVLLNACSAGFTPAFQATIPSLLPEEAQYTRALALSRLAYDLENLLSPALAALALLILSFSDLFILNGVAFICSAGLVLSAQFSVVASGGKRGFAQIKQGMRVYLRTPRLRGLFALSGAAASAGAMVIVNTVVHVQGTLGGSERETALVLAVYGAGSMLAALVAPRWLQHHADRDFMLSGAVLSGTALMLGMFTPDYLLLGIAWFVMGVGCSMIQTPAGRLLTRSAHEADRPMVFAAQFALSHVCWLVAYPLAGWLGGDFAIASLVLAVLTLVSILGAWLLWPAHGEGPLWHTHEEVAHSHEHVHDEHHQHRHDHLAGDGPHSHHHVHAAESHAHVVVIDEHHPVWPR